VREALHHFEGSVVACLVIAFEELLEVLHEPDNLYIAAKQFSSLSEQVRRSISLFMVRAIRYSSFVCFAFLVSGEVDEWFSTRLCRVRKQSVTFRARHWFQNRGSLSHHSS
jgi:hypothetical protein